MKPKIPKTPKILVSVRQRANALEALNVMWPSVPVKNVAPSLYFWRDGRTNEVDCGTVACFGGWCALYPKFREQGVAALLYGTPVLLIGGEVREGPHGVAEFLFGDASIFNMVPELNLSKAASHAVVKKRLQDLIAGSKVSRNLERED